MKSRRIRFADDDIESVGFLFRLRIFSLIIGLILGVLLSFAVSQFEQVLSKNISVAFFLPFVVYLADAVGTQTQNIYARDLRSGKANFRKYFIKESKLGLLFGLIFAVLIAPVIILWLHSYELALAVSLATFGAIASAPVIAVIVTEALQLQRSDPAAGAGPISTAIQDTVSVLIYGFIASAIIL